MEPTLCACTSGAARRARARLDRRQVEVAVDGGVRVVVARAPRVQQRADAAGGRQVGQQGLARPVRLVPQACGAPPARASLQRLQPVALALHLCISPPACSGVQCSAARAADRADTPAALDMQNAPARSAAGPPGVGAAGTAADASLRCPRPLTPSARIVERHIQQRLAVSAQSLMPCCRPASTRSPSGSSAPCRPGVCARCLP
jgi:hypothetical protein